MKSESNPAPKKTCPSCLAENFTFAVRCSSCSALLDAPIESVPPPEPLQEGLSNDLSRIMADGRRSKVDVVSLILLVVALVFIVASYLALETGAWIIALIFLVTATVTAGGSIYAKPNATPTLLPPKPWEDRTGEPLGCAAGLVKAVGCFVFSVLATLLAIISLLFIMCGPGRLR